MPSYGVTPAGFAVPPLSYLISQVQAQIWATINPTLDLSPQTPDGQMIAIIMNFAMQNWELLQICYNQFNRQDVEGAGLDNIGDLTATPREGASYTQVLCTLTLDPAHAPYAAGALVANVENLPAQTFSNANAITAAQITPNTAVIGTSASGSLVQVQVASTAGLPSTVTISNVIGTTEANGTWPISIVDSTHFTLTGSTYANAYVSGGTVTYGTTAIATFQSTTIGETPAVNDGTLNVITSAVTGWSAINNPGPGSQSQTGTNSELDSAYLIRQIEDLAAEGSCNPSATAEALLEFAASLSPPITISVLVLENTLWYYQVVNGLGLPPHSYAVVVYDPTSTLTSAQIGQIIYNNKPASQSPFGAIPVTIVDPVLGNESVAYSVPTPMPLYVSCTIIARTGFTHANVALAVQAALVAAAVAVTGANGVAPPGQLAPGASVYYSQLMAVIQNVPGVLNVTSLTFAFTPSPINTNTLVVLANQIATIAASTVATNVVVS